MNLVYDYWVQQLGISINNNYITMLTIFCNIFYICISLYTQVATLMTSISKRGLLQCSNIKIHDVCNVVRGRYVCCWGEGAGPAPAYPSPWSSKKPWGVSSCNKGYHWARVARGRVRPSHRFSVIHTFFQIYTSNLFYQTKFGRITFSTEKGHWK